MVEWFDDLTLGMRFKSAEKLVTREDIKRFAAEFDPQPYHLDEAAAEHTPLRGLAASGWHTAAIAMRLATDLRPFGPHPLLGIGVDELRWLAPVRPGDLLHIEGEVVELTPSRTKPQGVVKVKWTAFNQRGEPVYTFTPIGVVPRRPG
jgi:acyl dehydratase